MTTDLTDQLRSLPPTLDHPVDRFDRVGALVRRRTRRRALVAMTAGAVAAAVVVPSLLHLDEGRTARGPADSTTVSAEPTSLLRPSDGVVPMSEPLTTVRTGSATVDLGQPPAGATAISMLFSCMAPGRLVLPEDFGSTGCDEYGDPSPTLGQIMLLRPGQTQVSFEATTAMTWQVETQWVDAGPYPWGVNDRGQTFGGNSMYGNPDLQAVTADNGRPGYLDRAAISALDDGPGPGPRVVPVYAADGVTVVGRLERS